MSLHQLHEHYIAESKMYFRKAVKYYDLDNGHSPRMYQVERLGMEAWNHALKIECLLNTMQPYNMDTWPLGEESHD